MERLKNMKRLLAQAKLDLENNRLYIEDLELSIKHFEKNFPGQPEVRQDEIRFD